MKVVEFFAVCLLYIDRNTVIEQIILLFRTYSYKWKQFVALPYCLTLQTTEHRIPILNWSCSFIVGYRRKAMILSLLLQFLFCLLELEYFFDVILNKIWSMYVSIHAFIVFFLLLFLSSFYWSFFHIFVPFCVYLLPLFIHYYCMFILSASVSIT